MEVIQPINWNFKNEVLVNTCIPMKKKYDPTL